MKQRLNTINESLASYDDKKELSKEVRKKLDAIRREKVRHWIIEFIVHIELLL